jgi:HK97 family phage portal protein
VRSDPASNFWYQDPAWPDGSGVAVTPETALSSGAVFRATEIIANSVAQLPLVLYERLSDGGRRRAAGEQLHRLLTIRPNVWQTPYEFRQMLTGHLVLRGNAYARIVPGAGGFADQLVPLHPGRMSVEQLDNLRLRYVYSPQNGARQTLTQDEVFHLRGFSVDGLVGVSRISLMRTAVGLSIAGERFGAAQFGRRPLMAGILKYPGRFKDEGAARRIGESFRQLTAGPSGWHGVPVLEEGLDWMSVGMTNTDAEFLATRKFQVNEIARWMGVPPHLLADLDRATFSNIEHQAIDFVTFSLVAWLEAWEGAIERDLVVEPERLQVEHDTRALLRGDTTARFNAYRVGTGGRAVISPDEAREWEGLERRGGDLDEIHEGLGSTRTEPPGADASDAGAAPREQPAANRVAPHLNGHRRR